MKLTPYQTVVAVACVAAVTVLGWASVIGDAAVTGLLGAIIGGALPGLVSRGDDAQ